MAACRVKGISLKVALSAFVMAALIVGGAVWATTRLGGGDVPAVPSTVVFGDSITRLAAEDIAAETGAEVVAYDRAKWADLGPAVEAKLAERVEPPERAAVLLGANDVIELSMTSTDFAAVLDPLAGVPCVVVLELPQTFFGSQSFNEAMRAEVAKRPNAVTDDEWSALATSMVDQDNGTWFEEDKVHPNAEGQQQLAKSYASALDRHCGSASD